MNGDGLWNRTRILTNWSVRSNERSGSQLESPIGQRYQRLKAFVEELRLRLQQRLAARRTKEKIRTRAWELWDHHGRPVGRDVEFWLQAERELNENE
jgi:hypothetical protein